MTLLLFLPEVYVRILTNEIISISNDGECGFSSLCQKRRLFLDDGASFIKDFYFDLYMRMYNNFEPNTHYSTESSKIINKSYLEYCYKKFNK